MSINKQWNTEHCHTRVMLWSFLWFGLQLIFSIFISVLNMMSELKCMLAAVSLRRIFPITKHSSYHIGNFIKLKITTHNKLTCAKFWSFIFLASIFALGCIVLSAGHRYERLVLNPVLKPKNKMLRESKEPTYTEEQISNLSLVKVHWNKWSTQNYRDLN